MPKLWTETIEAHRRAVQDATLDATAALVAAHGLRSVTMSQIAETAGIGRATLYKYFPDVESILRAWHERQVTAHMELLAKAGGGAGSAGQRLSAVLATYARISNETGSDHGTDVGALLHGDAHVARAQQRLRDMISDLITEAAETGEFRDDVPPVELATYCLHAAGAARALPSDTAVFRLVGVVLAGLRVPSRAGGRA